MSAVVGITVNLITCGNFEVYSFWQFWSAPTICTLIPSTSERRVRIRHRIRTRILWPHTDRRVSLKDLKTSMLLHITLKIWQESNYWWNFFMTKKLRFFNFMQQGNFSKCSNYFASIAIKPRVLTMPLIKRLAKFSQEHFRKLTRSRDKNINRYWGRPKTIDLDPNLSWLKICLLLFSH